MADEKPPTTSRGIAAISAIGLVSVTGGAVGAMAWDVVVNKNSSAALVSIASIGIGALATLAGAAFRNGNRKDPE